MPSLSSLLLKIPDEFKPLAALSIGAVILVCLVLFHGFCLHRILVHFKRHEMRLQIGRPHLWRAGFLFGEAVFMMLTLHILEIATWAFALARLGLIVHPADALYFCANAYTTLGYGAVDLGPYWRNISPIIAISGLFTFAWTTSSLVSIVSSYLKLVEQLEEERLQEMNLRAGLASAEWDLRVKERKAEQAAREAAAQKAHSASFLERRRIREDERREEKQLRTELNAEVEDLREKERREEKRLGETAAQDRPEVKK